MGQFTRLGIWVNQGIFFTPMIQKKYLQYVCKEQLFSLWIRQSMIIFLINGLIVKCQKMVKNAHHKFQKLKAATSNVLFCQTNHPQSKKKKFNLQRSKIENGRKSLVIVKLKAMFGISDNKSLVSAPQILKVAVQSYSVVNNLNCFNQFLLHGTWYWWAFKTGQPSHWQIKLRLKNEVNIEY